MISLSKILGIILCCHNPIERPIDLLYQSCDRNLGIWTGQEALWWLTSCCNSKESVTYASLEQMKFVLVHDSSGKTKIINHSFGNGLYHLFMVIWGWFISVIPTLHLIYPLQMVVLHSDVNVCQRVNHPSSDPEMSFFNAAALLHKLPTWGPGCESRRNQESLGGKTMLHW